MKIKILFISSLYFIILSSLCYLLYRKKSNYLKLQSNKTYKIIDTTKDNLFNMSYMINNDNYLYGYGRPKFKNHKGHHKLYRKIIDLDGNIINNIMEVKLSNEVKDEFVGEVKSFLLNSEFYIYTNFWGKRKSLDIFPKWTSKNSKENYFKSRYKNYLWNLNTEKIIPLFYDKLPGKGFTHKNFLFFTDNLDYLVITNVSPHTIYKLDINSGYLTPYITTPNILEQHFKNYNVFLSGGPVKIPSKNCYLVAGHIAKGGWGGIRMTFFYTFRDKYPFDILSFTEAITFGFSDRIEYCNQIFNINENLYISLGINDDYSVLISEKIDTILSYVYTIYDSHRYIHNNFLQETDKILQFVEYFDNKNTFICDTKNIWGPDVEAEFIGNILYDYKLLSSNLDNIKNSQILGINIHKYSLNDVKFAIQKAKPKVLLIFGDEWGNKKDYEKLFITIPLVYRQYRFDNYDNKSNVKILPCGFHCWDLNSNNNNKNNRKYIWSFFGTIDKNDRKENLNKLNIIKPNFYGYTNKYENIDILNNSIFIFCPKGEKNIDSSRPYTASMCGAIPFLLCTDEEWNSLYPYFDIEPPWLYTDSIEKMINKMRELLQNPKNILELQLKIKLWWKNIQKIIYSNIDKIVYE